MAYDEFQTTPDFASKHAGSALSIEIYDENNPGAPIIGAATGINVSDDFEVIPIEEAGNEGVDEHTQGRHICNFTIQAFWSPVYGDGIQTRLDFIGRKYTIYVKIAQPSQVEIIPRPGAGETVDVLTGAVLSQRRDAFGARGARTIDLAGSADFHYTGEQWFELAGA